MTAQTYKRCPFCNAKPDYRPDLDAMICPTLECPAALGWVEPHQWERRNGPEAEAIDLIREAQFSDQPDFEPGEIAEAILYQIKEMEETLEADKHEINRLTDLLDSR